VRQIETHKPQKIHMSSAVRPYSGVASGARGEYGDLLPIRPAAGIPTRCLRDEYLTHYGMTQPYSHRYQLHSTLCLRTWFERDR
jgi:hypothetical protein